MGLAILAPWTALFAAGQQSDDPVDVARPARNAFELPFPPIETGSLASDLPALEFIEAAGNIPIYIPSERWGEQANPATIMQSPLAPEEALRHIVVPTGFRVELFASEPDLQGKPIFATWDERGRLWVCETSDYPNELHTPGEGNDRIRICEDTDGDGRADKFIVFAHNLSVPTSMAFSRGGVIVQNGTETIYLKDTNGDDTADERTTLVTGWAMGDTHGGVSNFQYGLDNWIWGMQGYNASRPVALGTPQQSFRMGFFRMRPDGGQIEFLRSTNNNTWGLGISEEGLVFGSTANGNPSVFLPIPNRYYERVLGWSPTLTLASIADSNRFLPITQRVRQVDHFGGFTAAAGHALYTARQYPQAFWNRVAFVCEPTGHLVAGFVLTQKGSGFTATNHFNLFASQDEWSAPVMAEVGPDGCVWVVDWYNYIVQHNPTPAGFETGKGNAYETPLRDKQRGRIYRVRYEGTPLAASTDLSQASTGELVAALKHPVMIVRKHAQRLLVERGQLDGIADLLELVNSREIDEIGLDCRAIHALWTLHGLGVVEESHPNVLRSVFAALQHPSPGVRRNAIQVLPFSDDSVHRLLELKLHLDNDPNVRLAAILAWSDMPSHRQTAQGLLEVLSHPDYGNDPWILEAVTCAAAQAGLDFLEEVTSLPDCSESAGQVTAIVMEHLARSDLSLDIGQLLALLNRAPPIVISRMIEGLNAGWRESQAVAWTEDLDIQLEGIARRASPGDLPAIVRLGQRWGSSRLTALAEQVANDLMSAVLSEELSDQERIRAARQAVDMQSDSDEMVERLLECIRPRLSPELAEGIIDSLSASRSRKLGTLLIRHLSEWTPSARRAGIRLMLQRSASSLSLLNGIDQGTISLTELSLDQRQSLLEHPNREVRAMSRRVFQSGGSLPSTDRARVVQEMAPLVAEQAGDVDRGVDVFKQHCAKCHQHHELGTKVGPDLTGMSVHPKEELLIQILDPNRSVENNFRAYSVLTVDGVVLTGMLAAESKTAIELYDAEGKRQAIQREDIEQLSALPQSIMPDGFEKMMSPSQLADLLEFLTNQGRFVSLDLTKASTVATDRGMFLDSDGPERILLDDWSPKLHRGIPFRLIEPRDGRVLNAIQLYGPLGKMSQTMPRNVSIPCSGSAKSIHVLGGVAGWGFPLGRLNETVMIVRIHYGDGVTEDHDLLNGVHIADYIRRIDVPGSEFAFESAGKQLRYLAIKPRREEPITLIEFAKGQGDYSPLIMAVTIENP